MEGLRLRGAIGSGEFGERIGGCGGGRLLVEIFADLRFRWRNRCVLVFEHGSCAP